MGFGVVRSRRGFGQDRQIRRGEGRCAAHPARFSDFFDWKSSESYPRSGFHKNVFGRASQSRYSRLNCNCNHGFAGTRYPRASGSRGPRTKSRLPQDPDSDEGVPLPSASPRLWIDIPTRRTACDALELKNAGHLSNEVVCGDASSPHF